MRNFLKIISILLFVFLCSGCVTYQEEMKIHNTKALNLKVTYLVDQEKYSYDVLSEEDILLLKQNGFRVKEYEKGSSSGYVISYRISNIDKVSNVDEVSYSLTSIRTSVDDDMFQVKKSWFRNVYVAHFFFDSTDVGVLTVGDNDDVMEYLCEDGSVLEVLNGQEIERTDCFRATKNQIENIKNGKSIDEDFENFSSSNELTFSCKLDHPFLSHNASQKNRNDTELEWTLQDNGVTDILFEFSLLNIGHILLTVLFGLLFLFLIFFLFFSFQKNRNEKKR